MRSLTPPADSRETRRGAVAVEVALAMGVTITIATLMLVLVKWGSLALQASSAVFIGWGYL